MNAKPQMGVVSSGVDTLIARLRDEGVNEGKKRAEQLVAEAEKNAQAIVEKATASARERVEVAQKEADAYLNAGREALKVAMRDLVLELKAGLMRHFSAEVQRLVREQAMDRDFLRRMILQLVGRSGDAAKLEGEENLEVILPTEVVGLEDLRRRPEELMQGDLTKFIFGVEGEILRKGVRFSQAEDQQVGVVVRLVDKDIKLDLTDKACADLLLEHLQPRFRAIMEGVVK